MFGSRAVAKSMFVKSMRTACLLAIGMGLWAAIRRAQTVADLLNNGHNTDNVTTESMGYDRKNCSPIEQINRSNVKRLVPVWSTRLMNDRGRTRRAGDL